MSRPPSAFSRPPIAPPGWNVTQANSLNANSFHILHRPATTQSTSSPAPSRPHSAAPRLQRPVTAKSPFLSYDTAASPATGSSTPVPFSLLDSINAHRSSSKGRRGSSSSTRPASAYGKRERRSPRSDSLEVEEEADMDSATIEVTPPQQQWRLRERQRQHREEELVKYEEKKEADDSHATRPQHAVTHLPAPLTAHASSSAIASVLAASSANRIPPSVAALASYTPQSFEQSASLQHSIQLLHAAPLLASFLPSLASLDTAWSSLIASHSLYRQSESRQMAALREEELRIRDAMLTFMRVSMEYRRSEVHDAADGTIATSKDDGTTPLHESEEDGWLVRDDGQRASIDVDWNGRYWQSERRREKEAWYRAEERELQSMYERGVQLLTELYRHKFELLMRIAGDQRSTARSSPQVQQLNTQLHETLTALRLQFTNDSTQTATSELASGSTLLPPRHPALSAYAGRLHASLNELSALLLSHYQQVAQLVEHSHTLASASASIEQLVRSLHDEERERREEVEQLKRDKRQLREEQKRSEAEWEEKVQLERLEVCAEREGRLRVESEMAELRDTLARIQATYEADWQRRQSVADKDTQCEAAEATISVRMDSEASGAEEQAEKEVVARKLQSAFRTKQAKASAGGSASTPRASGKHSFQLNLSSPQSSGATGGRLSPRSAASPRSAQSGASPPVSPRSRSPRSSGGGAFALGGGAAAVGRSGSSSGGPASGAASVAVDGSGKGVRPALRGGAIADGTARLGKAATSPNAKTERAPSNSDGRGLTGRESTDVSADKRRWDGVPFV